MRKDQLELERRQKREDDEIELIRRRQQRRQQRDDNEIEQARRRQEREDRQALQEAAVRDKMRRDRIERFRSAENPRIPRHRPEIHHKWPVIFKKRREEVIDEAIREHDYWRLERVDGPRIRRPQLRRESEPQGLTLQRQERTIRVVDMENNDFENSSDVASVGSLATTPGLTFDSTLSTVSSQEVLGAAEELAILLLQDEDLKPLYEKALERMEIKKFKRNLTKLLGIFGIDLLKEAGSDPQKSAAQFVKERAKYVTSCIGKYYTLGKDEASEHMDVLIQQASQREGVVEEYLQQQVMYNTSTDAFAAHSESKDVRRSEEEPEFDESQPDIGDRPQLPNLDGVKNFILDSFAISNLRKNLRHFVFGESDNYHVKDVSAYPPVEASMLDNSDEITRLQDSDWEDLTESDEASMFDNNDEITRLEDSDLEELMESDEATVIQLESMPKQAAFGTDIQLRSILPVIKWFAEFLELREKPLKPGYRRIRWKCVRHRFSFN